MADDKTTKTPEQPVTDSGPGKETPPAPPKESEPPAAFPVSPLLPGQTFPRWELPPVPRPSFPS